MIGDEPQEVLIFFFCLMNLADQIAMEFCKGVFAWTHYLSGVCVCCLFSGVDLMKYTT